MPQYRGGRNRLAHETEVEFARHLLSRYATMEVKECD